MKLVVVLADVVLLTRICRRSSCLDLFLELCLLQFRQLYVPSQTPTESFMPSAVPSSVPSATPSAEPSTVDEFCENENPADFMVRDGSGCNGGVGCGGTGCCATANEDGTSNIQCCPTDILCCGTTPYTDMGCPNGGGCP